MSGLLSLQIAALKDLESTFHARGDRDASMILSKAVGDLVSLSAARAWNDYAQSMTARSTRASFRARHLPR